MKRLALSVLPDRLAICRLDPGSPLPEPSVRGSLWSVTRTNHEISVILVEEDVPPGCRAEGGWRCLEAAGPFDFNLTGVLASLTGPLAEAGVPIFALSTFDTDYLLVREWDLDKAVKILEDAGHTVVETFGPS